MQRYVIAIVLLLALLLATGCQRHPVAKKPKLEPVPVQISLVEPGEQLNPYGSFFAGDRVSDTYVENVGMVSAYKFVARRFPPEAKLVLASQNLGCPLKPIGTYDVDDDGCLGRQINAATLMLDNEILLMFDFFRGEPVKYWVVSTDGKIRLSTTIVPYPIKAEGKDGAYLSLTRITPDARLMLCEGFDFNPDEEIWVSTQSGTLRTHNTPIICTNGRFSMVLEPAPPKRSGGVAYIDVQRRGERLSLEYDWGCEAINAKKRQGNSQRIQPDALLKLPTNL